MRVLFVIGAGILPEQRIKRWQMVSQLYANLGKAMMQLGHQVYYYVHPEAYVDDVPPSLTWLCEGHEHMPQIMETFRPDFVFCWNGSSAGDHTTTTIAHSFGAKMVYSEQGWFPQKSTLYFDMSGCNGKCGTKNKQYPELNSGQRGQFLKARKVYLEAIGEDGRFDTENFRVIRPTPERPILVPLQDERDLNIVQDSPFKTMDAFVGFLAEKYPTQQFIARPHPKYPNPALGTYANVVVDNPKTPMFDTLSRCSMVVGINSTTLQESALLGYTVVSFGESLATGTGLFVDCRPESAPETLTDMRVKTEAAQAVLYHLACVKQMEREKLDQPVTVMRSAMFRELTENLNWNNIYR